VEVYKGPDMTRCGGIKGSRHDANMALRRILWKYRTRKAKLVDCYTTNNISYRSLFKVVKNSYLQA